MVSPPGEKPNASLEGGLVRYDKRAPAPGWRHIDYGLSVLSRVFLEGIPATAPLDLAEPLAAASARGELRGYLATEPFREINTPEALEAFRAHFGKKPAAGP
jgi:NDP-sugar pyrophosphorylase family protein